MAGQSLLLTPLAPWHQSHGGRLVEFGGWSMPVQYTTIAEEHRAVRQRAGLFDISHMGRLTFHGPGALDWLERATTNHVARLAPGQIQYSLMANDRGGVIDDVLVYRLQGDYLLVCNASNRSKVLAQLEALRPASLTAVSDGTLDTAMIAIQGPQALATLAPLVDVPVETLRYYHAMRGQFRGTVGAVISRTGYTGEDGFELMIAAGDAVGVWEALLAAGRARGIVACGLGARDTLRFEAAMPLYGHELSEAINPYAAGVGWAVKLEKGEFVGRAALRAFKSDPGQTRVGLRLEGKRIARQGCTIFHDGRSIGTVTSGTFAPSLEESLAMALVETSAKTAGSGLTVDVRGHREPARIVKLPFYQRSQVAGAGTGH